MGYTPRHAMAPGAQGQTWEEHMIKITKAAKKISPKMASKMGSKYDLKETCGIEGPPSKAEGRIVGGVEAEPNRWPWQVALFIDDAWFCRGALISENWVVTAAHCADGASYFDVMAGAHDVRASSEPTVLKSPPTMALFMRIMMIGHWSMILLLLNSLHPLHSMTTSSLLAFHLLVTPLMWMS